jgi:aerobic-type carbon monoxide dehydrogenase small subunit (CoxS/CutS family)
MDNIYINIIITVNGKEIEVKDMDDVKLLLKLRDEENNRPRKTRSGEDSCWAAIRN